MATSEREQRNLTAASALLKCAFRYDDMTWVYNTQILYYLSSTKDMSCFLSAGDEEGHGSLNRTNRVRAAHTSHFTF